MNQDLPRSLKIATLWLLLILALFLAFQAWQRERQAAHFTAAGGIVELRRAADGHYHWPGTVNGRATDFLVDTGATASAIPMALASELALPQLGSMRSSTAGGVVDGRIVVAELALQGGPRVERMRLAALPSLQSPLLGMDVLGRLRLQQQGGVLRIDMSALAAERR